MGKYSKSTEDKLEKAHGQQATQAWQEISTPSQWNSIWNLDHLWSFQIVKTQGIQAFTTDRGPLSSLDMANSRQFPWT